MAEHIWEFDHRINFENCKKLKAVNNNRQLNAWESLYMTENNSTLMNKEPPPITSQLFNLTGLEIIWSLI